MRVTKSIRFCLFTLFACSLCFGQVNVLTFHNDNLRTGGNVAETILSPGNVNASSFGKLYAVSVDGKVDAQPLYVSSLAIPGQTAPHNVVYAATEHGSVYAFDADSGAVYWRLSLLRGGETPSDARGCDQVVPEIGITSTGVIDLSVGPHGTIYLIAMSKDAAGNYFHRLHALDIATGAEEFGGPVLIQATYPGTGANSQNGSVVFDAKQYKDRAGLMLLNGLVYTNWGSHCDVDPYTGWTIAYDKATLQQKSVFNFAPNGSEAALWNSGGAPAADAAGNLYFAVANGTFDTNLTTAGFPIKADYGNSFVKLTLTSGKLSAVDYWTMDNTVSESSGDTDLGSGGIMLLPDVKNSAGTTTFHLGVGAGKDGNLYVVNRDNMGKFDPQANATIYQVLNGALPGGIWGNPAYFDGHVYFGAVNDSVRSFDIVNAQLSSAPSSLTASKFGFPGISPSVSSNGTANGILWAVESSNPAVLHAYDATNLATELYNSNIASSGRDQFGTGNKFIAPTIANGKVFVGTTNSVAVFGLLHPAANPVLRPNPGTYGSTQSVAIADATPGATIYYTADGSNPTTSSAKYTSPILVLWETTVKAFAVASGGAPSPIVTGFYAIDRPLAAPTFSLPSGSYSAPRSIAITGPSYCVRAVCVIYYTTNGSTPNLGSPRYSGPIALTGAGTTTLKAIVTSHHFAASNVTSATYTLH